MFHSSHIHKQHTMDLCHGGLWRQIIVFSLPLMFSILLQQAFNMADLIVVGKFASPHDMAAVGATSSLTNLLIGFFVGISSGAAVIAAKIYGARDCMALHKTAVTSMAISCAFGIFLTIVGIVGARPMLTWMKTPSEVLELAIRYLQICFAGMIFNMIYNFGSAILRAVGDTRRPLYYLVFAGIVNVFLNLFFVIVLHWGVAGVGVATVVSQAISSVLVWMAVNNTSEIGGLHLRELGIDFRILGNILKIGIPSGLQSISFCIANIIIQTSINAYGAMALAGNTAALSIEYLLSTFGGTAYQAAISFCAQNLGGKQYKRLRECVVKISILACTTTLIASFLIAALGPQVLSLYTSNPETISWGMLRINTMFYLYVSGALMNTLTGALRGLGYSVQSFIIVLIFACLFRIVWICTIYQMHKTLPMLLVVFPISWILIAGVALVYMKHIFAKLPNFNVAH